VYRYIVQLRAEVHRVNIELYKTSVREKGLLHMIESEANRQARLLKDFEKVLNLLEASIKHSPAIEGAPSPEDSKPQSS
jgi:excinuclease UvrABC nuclease subunit